MAVYNIEITDGIPGESQCSFIAEDKGSVDLLADSDVAPVKGGVVDIIGW